MASAGALKERVTFQRLDSSAVDDYGNVYTGWSNLASRFADLRERTGKESIQGGALSDTNFATMRCRSDSVTEAVTSADRVVARGITWAIKNVIQVDEKDTLMEFVLERGVAS